MRCNMLSRIIVFVALFLFVVCEASQSEGEVESRGKKKKKIALFVFFADLVLKKIFILKLIYAFVFWVVIHKAGYFLSWFVSYLKEQKHHHDHSSHHYEYVPAPHYEHYAHSYGPYRREAHRS